MGRHKATHPSAGKHADCDARAPPKVISAWQDPADFPDDNAAGTATDAGAAIAAVDAGFGTDSRVRAIVGSLKHPHGAAEDASLSQTWRQQQQQQLTQLEQRRHSGSQQQQNHHLMRQQQNPGPFEQSDRGVEGVGRLCQASATSAMLRSTVDDVLTPFSVRPSCPNVRTTKRTAQHRNFGWIPTLHASHITSCSSTPRSGHRATLLPW